MILTPGVVTEEMVQAATLMTGKGGKVTVTAVGKATEKAVHVHAGFLIGYQRQIRGALFGDCNPLYDVPKLLGLYRSGDLNLNELITRRYALDEVNDAYRDLNDRMNDVALATEFGSLIRRELDIESLLRTVLEFVLTKSGPTNAAIFLPASSGDFSLAPGFETSRNGPS